ncbi:MAG: DNA polymerase III subunit [Planctomycetales bacterium]|nr:DNA polymerase III subunit [Planctomycetales bacterium]
MQWSDLLGHEQPKEWFRTALANRRLGTSFLFVGPPGIGKRTFARLLAKGLLCRGTEPESLEACGQCEDCTQVDASTHPDLVTVAKPADKAFIPVELLIGERDKRMREGLCHDISLRPYAGRRKIAILDDADYFNTEGANCLLKTLEEPPTDSVLILLGTSLQRQLPTIRSRCQAILFRPLEHAQLQTLLLRNGLAETTEEADSLASRCGGSLAEAQCMADPDINDFRGVLLETLSKPQLPLMALAKSCGALVDAAGKDARLKRERMKLIFRLAARFYRALACGEETATGQGAARTARCDPPLAQALQVVRRGGRLSPPAATEAWSRCLLAMEQVDRNANQAGLLEAWSADLARLSDC